MVDLSVVVENIGDAFIIQGLNDVAADKARAAGNDDHKCNLRIMESETISDTNTSNHITTWLRLQQYVASCGVRNLCWLLLSLFTFLIEMV